LDSKAPVTKKLISGLLSLLLGYLDPATLSFERIDLDSFDAKTNFKNAA
jgi:hypothetical protein